MIIKDLISQGENLSYLEKLVEQLEGEYLPWDESTNASLARQFLRATKGDENKAMKMAEYFHQQLLTNIQKHAKARWQMKSIGGRRKE